MEKREEVIGLLVSAIEHMRRQSQKVIELSQGLMALVQTLEELSPEFRAAYVRNYVAAGQSLESQGFVVPHHLFDGLIAGVQRNG